MIDLSQCDKDITPWWHIIIHEAPTTGTTEVIPFYPGPGIDLTGAFSLPPNPILYIKGKWDAKSLRDILKLSCQVSDRVGINARLLNYGPCFFFTDITVVSLLLLTLCPIWLGVFGGKERAQGSRNTGWAKYLAGTWEETGVAFFHSWYKAEYNAGT